MSASYDCSRADETNTGQSSQRESHDVHDNERVARFACRDGQEVCLDRSDARRQRYKKVCAKAGRATVFVAIKTDHTGSEGGQDQSKSNFGPSNGGMHT